MGAVAYAGCAQGDAPFERWGHLVLHTEPGLALYVLLIVNLCAVSVRHMMRLLGPRVGRIEAMDEHVEGPHALSAQDIARWLRDNGYHVSVHGDEVAGVRGRWAFIAGLTLRAGLVLMLMAVGASSHLRQTEQRVLHTGDEAAMLGHKLIVRDIRATLPENFLQVGERVTFEITDLGVQLDVDGQATRATSGYAARARGLYLRATDFGYRVPVLINGARVAEDLAVLPPGKAQRIGELSLTVEPSKTMTKGLLTGKAYNLKSPRFRLVASGGEGLVLGPGESSGSHALGADGGYFVRLIAVRDPALVWLHIGLGMFVLGALLMTTRMFWYASIIEARITHKRIMIGQSAEINGNWNVQRFRDMLLELGLAPSSGQDETQAAKRDQHPAD